MERQFAGRQSSRGRFVPSFIMMSKRAMIGGPSAAAAFVAVAVSGSTTMKFDQATIATTITRDRYGGSNDFAHLRNLHS